MTNTTTDTTTTSGIVRAPRPRQRFTILDNALGDDRNLTVRAFGLLVLILMKPDNWRTSAEALSRQYDMGRDAIRRTLSEIEAAGYLSRTKHQNELGQWITTTTVYDTPQAALVSPRITPTRSAPNLGRHKKPLVTPETENPSPGAETAKPLVTPETENPSPGETTETPSPTPENPSPGNPAPGRPGAITRTVSKNYEQDSSVGKPSHQRARASAMLCKRCQLDGSTDCVHNDPDATNRAGRHIAGIRAVLAAKSTLTADRAVPVTAV